MGAIKLHMITLRNYYKIIEWVDMCLILPFISRLGTVMAHKCSHMRGAARYFLDLDWRSSCLGQPFLRHKTSEVIRKKITHKNIQSITRKRFITQAREELEAFFILNNRRNWPISHNITPINWFDQIPADKGIVLLAGHIDSSWAGMLFLASCTKRPINFVYDKVVWHPGVFSFFQNFFRKKYTGITSRLNGGTFISPEDLRKTGEKKLMNGEIIVFFADIPRLHGFMVTFLGEKVQVPFGGPSYALRSNSYIGTYITRFIAPGRYVTTLSDPMLVTDNCELTLIVETLYKQLEKNIYEDPGVWWAADTFLQFCTHNIADKRPGRTATRDNE